MRKVLNVSAAALSAARLRLASV